MITITFEAEPAFLGAKISNDVLTFILVNKCPHF